MADNNTIQNLGKFLALRNVTKIRESSFIGVTHMHSTIEHYIPIANRNQNATSSYILTSTLQLLKCGYYYPEE
jgi:hypothetical protein